MSCGIYKFTNKKNGKIYIGQSVNIEERYLRHFRKDNTRNIPYFHRALLKYGKEGFDFEIIEECPKEKLNEREIYWITYYKSNNRELGYNSTDGGEGAKSRSIKQYNLKGELIQEFNSLTNASKALNIPMTNLCLALKGKRKSCGGYQWRYSEDAPPGIYDGKSNHITSRHKLKTEKIEPPKLKKKDIVLEWKRKNPKGTVTECFKATGISRPTIYRYWK